MTRFPSFSSLSLWLAAAGCMLSSGANAQPQENTFRIRLNADIRSTDPGVNRDANTDYVMAHLLEGLVAFKEDTTVGLLLAQSVNTSPDGKTYTFKLRPGLKFSNGAPLTADDVVFSWNRYMKPETGWRCVTEFDGRSGLAKVLKIEAKDPLTVVYTLEKPAGLFLVTLARGDCGGTGIYHKSSIGPDGKWLEPVGSGPFKMGTWKRGQYLELLRNENYVALPGKPDGNTGNKTPSVSKVRWVVVPDPSAAKAALLSGGLDLIFDAEPEDLGEYKSRKDVVVQTVPTMSQTGFIEQTRDPILKDPRIRRAFAMSLDVPQIVDAVTNGTAKPSRSAIPTPSPYYTAVQADLPKRDLAGAKKLLAEAGYKGQPIKMQTTKRYAYLFTSAVMAQAMAEEAGFKIDIEVLDWATLLDRYTRGDYQMLAYSYSSRLDPSLSYEMFTGNRDKQPRKVWENPEAIDLINQSMEVTDKAKRQPIFDKLEAKLREDASAVWLYCEVMNAATRPYVKGYVGWPLGQPRAWSVTLK
jgi:peptide/nickel transport system substrate-binding protein